MLSPVVHDGSVLDAVYGVDAQGRYLGLTTAANAAQAASCAPPAMGEYRWVSGAWVPFQSVEQRGAEIEAARDATLAGGVTWSGRQWYADTVFQQQIAAYLQAFIVGILPAAATVGIRSMDKTVYQLTQLELVELAGTLMQFVQQAYVTSWAAKAAIGAD